jgi:polysaccharide transporter, PST family
MKELLDRGVGSARRLVRSRVAETATTLYASAFTSYLLPLVTIPYLARVLTPDVWGLVVFIQSLTLYVGMIVNYSFDLSATRSVAQLRNDPEQLAEIVAGVLAARTVLAVVCVTLIAIGQQVSSALNELGLLLWLATFASIAFGFGPFWYFLGIERVRWYTALGVAGKLTSLVMILLFVNAPQDASRVFAIYAVTSTVVSIITVFMMYRDVPVRWPSISSAMGALRDGWNLFVFHVSISVYGTSNTIILGFLAPAGVVAFYAGAEKLFNAITMMIQPIVQAMYPRAARLAKDDLLAAAWWVRVTIGVSFAVACLASLLLYFAAPRLIPFALGPGYEDAVPVLRILLIILPMVAVTTPLIVHWIIPLGLESLATKMTIAAGIVHVPLSFVLASRFAHLGVASALVVTQLILMFSLIIYLVYVRRAPFGAGIRSQEPDRNAARIGGSD